MNRRELIKAIIPIAAISLVVKEDVVAQVFKLDKEAKYIVLINPVSGIDPDDFCINANSVLPVGTPVFVGHEEDLKIFKL